MRTMIIAALSLAILGTGSCKKFDDAINDVKNEGSLTATVNGKAYSAGAATMTFSTKSALINGSNFSNDEELSIYLTNYDKTTTRYILDGSKNTASYNGDKSTDIDAVSGELEIQHTGDESAKGTFYFISADSLKVTNGSFELDWGL